MARFEPSGPLRGSLRPPPDKSISHRAALIGAMADGPTGIANYLDSADTRSTLEAVAGIGAEIEGVSDSGIDPSITIHGVGLRGAGPAELDVGNAGTLLRLLPGWLAGQGQGVWTLDGDDSIRRRPMDRVADPLRLMGASVCLPRGAAAADADRGRQPPGDLLRDAGRQRPGQVLPPAGRAAGRGRDQRPRAGPEPRPQRADAGRRGRRGLPQRGDGQDPAGPEPAPGRDRGPGRHLGRRLLHRRRHDRPRQRAVADRGRPQPDQDRAARDPRADGGCGRDRGRRSGRRAERVAAGLGGGAGRDRGRWRRGAAGDRRAAAGRPRRLLRRGRDDDPRCRGAPSQGERQDRDRL